ncbi:SDR family NAD(P)-dependent oxidoreductase [Microbispora sp. NPDC049125]|uniref:SDR family NAD(P)-dependent oxidoreductase n=1 Tax=Microbispora sp. NPDC049125 TaxID=3154929 RepID=UPI0034672852
MRFADKVALVTGGGGGIGRAVARAFAREGATVVVTGRGEEPLRETVALIESAGGTGSFMTADVTRSADVALLVQDIVSRHGGLDIAVNNAGVFALGTVASLDEAEWARVMDVNVKGVFLSMKHEVAAMRERGGGVIVNLSSTVGAHRRMPNTAAYAASKAAVSALTRTAALDHIREGIRINAISPGPHDTPMSMRPGEDEAARAARVKKSVPIGRVGRLEELASSVLWLASDEAGFAVGQDFVLDGGVAA